MITLYDDKSHIPLLWTHLIPATLEGKALHNVQNAMAAAVVAYAQGTQLKNIRQGLRTFDASYFQVPGRLNVYNDLPFKVILDYAHNPAAVQCMVDLVGRLDVPGRRLCVLSAPGDRRDQDVLEIGQIAAKGTFDHIIVRRDDSLRGRGPDEVPMLLRQGLMEAGYPESNITVIIDEQEAVDHALQACVRGDLLLVLGDKVSRCWKQIVRHNVEGEDSVGDVLTPTDNESALRTEAAFTVDAHLIADERGVRLAREASD